MDKSESKYFHTALRMNEALISLLEKKDLDFITVKEICQEAGVNRSTFYLHYETISDLMDETLQTVARRFETCFPQNTASLLQKPDEQQLSDLVLITKAYLLPYLQFIKDNQKVYRAAYRNPVCMQSHVRYRKLQAQIVSPILTRFGIPDEVHKYYCAYYVEGITALIREWLKHDCEEEIDQIADIIENCVRPQAYAHDKS